MRLEQSALYTSEFWRKTLGSWCLTLESEVEAPWSFEATAPVLTGILMVVRQQNWLLVTECVFWLPGYFYILESESIC